MRSASPTVLWSRPPQETPPASCPSTGTASSGSRLGPVIAEVKARLADQGVGFASAIPEISRTIVIAQSDALVTVRVVYGIAVTVGTWLPVVTLLLFVGGTVVARRRGVALLGAGLGLALGSARTRRRVQPR